MAKINVRSPHYVYLNESNLSFVELKIWIYTGTQGSRPTIPTYNVSAFAVNETVNFEISELVRDYMVYDSIDYQTPIVWVDYQIIKTVGSTTTTLSIVLNSGFYGYGYFEDGSNPQNNSGLLQSNLTIVKLDDAPVYLPIDTSKVSSVSYYYNNQQVYSRNITSSTNSNSQIEYVTNAISPSDEFENRVINDGGIFEGSLCLTDFLNNVTLFPVDAIYIDSIYGVDLIKVYSIEECKYQPYKLTFINKYGALQDIWFFKRSNKNLTTNKESFKRNTLVGNSYGLNNHQQKNLFKQGNEKMDLNTGFYPEVYNEVFKQMQLSEDVWIEIDNKVLPINISDSSFSYKTGLNDKLINYTIKVDFAFDTINNIR